MTSPAHPQLKTIGIAAIIVAIILASILAWAAESLLPLFGGGAIVALIAGMLAMSRA